MSRVFPQGFSIPDDRCTIEGCFHVTSRVSDVVYCHRHYTRWKKHGDPLIDKRKKNQRDDPKPRPVRAPHAATEPILSKSARRSKSRDRNSLSLGRVSIVASHPAPEDVESERRCNQCWQFKPIADFRYKKDPNRFGTTCRPCLDHYQGWADKTLEERARLMRHRDKPRSGSGYRVSLVLRSANQKTGPIPVSTTDMASCPDVCSFKNSGCYAENGKSQYHWDLIGKSTRGGSWEEFCEKVRTLPDGQLWRHNEAGDLPGLANHLDVKALAKLVEANRGKKGFTFTHKPLATPKERHAVQDANHAGFTINLSADSLIDADRKADLEIAPVVVVVPEDAPIRMTTPKGRVVVVCINERTGITCDECHLCAVSARKSIIAFRAHGRAKSIVSELVRAKRELNT